MKKCGMCGYTPKGTLKNCLKCGFELKEKIETKPIKISSETLLVFDRHADIISKIKPKKYVDIQVRTANTIRTDIGNLKSKMRSTRATTAQIEGYKKQIEKLEIELKKELESRTYDGRR